MWVFVIKLFEFLQVEVLRNFVCPFRLRFLFTKFERLIADRLGLFFVEVMATDRVEEWREMFGDSDSEDESFYGFSDVEDGDSSGDEAEEFPIRLGQQGDLQEGAYVYAYWLQEFTEETGVNSLFESEEPSEMEIVLKVFNDDIYQLIVVMKELVTEQDVVNQ